MSRRSTAASKHAQPASKPKQPAPKPDYAIALKPRPKLFYALLVIFVLWLGFLVTLYFTTVYHKTDVHLESTTDRSLR